MNPPILAAALLPLLLLPAYPQNPRASLQGLVSYPDGSPVPNAPIQLKRQTGGQVARARSDANGHYKFSALADGKSDLTIRMPCCAYFGVTKEVAVALDQAQQFDVKPVETLKGSTLGDDPARNVSGVWLLTDDPYPEVPQLLPAAEARRTPLAKDPRNAPHNRCLPGPPPFSLLVALFEDYPGFRQILLDRRKHPTDPNPS